MARTTGTMLDRLGLERRDGRNLAIVVAIVMLVIFVLVGGPLFVRSVVALIGGAVSGLTFLLVTILIKRYGPDVPS